MPRRRKSDDEVPYVKITIKEVYEQMGKDKEEIRRMLKGHNDNVSKKIDKLHEKFDVLQDKVEKNEGSIAWLKAWIGGVSTLVVGVAAKLVFWK